MTDPPQSSSPARTFWDRPRRRLQQGLGFVYGTLLVGIFVDLVSNLLSFPSIFDWITHHLLISGLIGGGLLLLTVLACWGDRPSLPPMTMTASSLLDHQSRARVLKHVRKIWIEGLLDQSLHRAARIDLHLQEQPDALENPWRFQVQELDRESHPLPVGTSIVQVYDEADGELLILGEPGAGKTTLLLELARTLLGRAEHNEQLHVPIVFHLASWAEKRQPLCIWLTEELRTKYKVSRKVGQSWIDTGQVLPLLDGLDEVAKDARSACVEHINDYQSRLAHGISPLVVCCRSEEYAALSTRIKLQHAVSILPLTASQINTYLAQAGKQVTGLRQALEEDAELYSLARQPLMLNIFSLAYQGATASEVPTGETREETQRSIFARYVERMLKRRGQSKHWKPEQVTHWLTFLAKQMQQHDQTIFSVSELQPTWLSAKKWRMLYRWCAGLFAGLLYGMLIGLVTGLLAGLLMGLFAEGILVLTFQEDEALSELSWWLTHLIFLLVIGLFYGIFTGLFAGLLAALLRGLLGGLLTGLFAGLFMGLLTWLLSALEEVPRAWRVGLLGGLLAVPFHWLPIWLLAGTLGGLLGGLLGGTLGGLFIRLLPGLNSFVKHFILRCLLSWQGNLPWNPVPFLDEAAERLLLRKASRSYIFVHRLLLEYFVSLGEPVSTISISKSSKP